MGLRRADPPLPHPRAPCVPEMGSLFTMQSGPLAIFGLFHKVIQSL